MKKYVVIVFALLLTFSHFGFAQDDSKRAPFPGMKGTQVTETKVFPEKIEADKNFDGKADYAEYYKNGVVDHREADTDFDGIMDEWTYFDPTGKPIKTERDTNKDGKPDAWVYYKDKEGNI